MQFTAGIRRVLSLGIRSEVRREKMHVDSCQEGWVKERAPCAYDSVRTPGSSGIWWEDAMLQS